MNIDLKGRVAVVTGASRGIGLAIGQGLAEAGASVMLVSRSAASLAAAVESSPGDVDCFPANAGDPDAAAAAIDATMARFGAIDILVNNAGTNPYNGPLVDLDLPRAAKTCQVNQFGPVMWAGMAWRAHMAEHGGSVLNIASLGAFGTSPSLGFYDGTKAALLALTKQLAWELRPKVRVNAIAPGVVKTDFARKVWEEHEAEIASRTCLGWLAEPEDVAGLAVFLSSDHARWITGAIVVADGGMGSMPLGGEHLAE